MLHRLKLWLYFPVARYFRFWAWCKLKRWQPRIIVVTGSSGKTTLLHLLEAQLGDRAHYSHHANSAFGIPFDILGFAPGTGARSEWIGYFLEAPFRAFGRSHEPKLYVVEADADRAGEGRFLAKLLRPEVTIWLSSDLSHGGGFDHLVRHSQFKSPEEAIAHEFGYFLAATTGRVIIRDQPAVLSGQRRRTTAEVMVLSDNEIQAYTIGPGGTSITRGHDTYDLPALLPRAAGVSVLAAIEVCQYLKVSADPSFSAFVLPPSRSSVLQGVKGTTIIDSSYNAQPDAVAALLEMFAQYPGGPKWAVIGDMIEQGQSEAAAHEELAGLLHATPLDRIILMGPRVAKYTAPKLAAIMTKDTPIVTFTKPSEALDYLEAEIRGGEIILFKGARFMEGIIEHLLADPTDVARLCRRGPMWGRRRAQWGL